MIEIRAKYDPLSLKMDGHAQSERNEHDHDLVCCAASMLVQALVRSCALYPGIAVVGEAGSGHIDFRLECDKVGQAPALHRFQMCMDGLEMLEKSYPQSLHVVYA